MVTGLPVNTTPKVFFDFSYGLKIFNCFCINHATFAIPKTFVFFPGSRERDVRSQAYKDAWLLHRGKHHVFFPRGEKWLLHSICRNDHFECSKCWPKAGRKNLKVQEIRCLDRNTRDDLGYFPLVEWLRILSTLGNYVIEHSHKRYVSRLTVSPIISRK